MTANLKEEFKFCSNCKMLVGYMIGIFFNGIYPLYCSTKSVILCKDCGKGFVIKKDGEE